MEFPPEEFRRRQDLMAQEMVTQRLDAVLLTHAPNIRWLTGYHIQLMETVKQFATIVLFTAEAGPRKTLICATDATGTDLAHTDEVVFWHNRAGSPYESHTNPVAVLVNQLVKHGLARKRIGMELGDGMRLDMPQRDIEQLRNAMHGATFVDFSSSLWTLRSIKSELEIGKLRRAAEITLKGYGAGFERLREGMTERELWACICAKWFELGATGIGFLGIVSGPQGVRYAHVGPGDRRIRKGEIINIDGGCLVDGYWADVFRMASLGEPVDMEMVRLVDCIREAEDEMIAAIRPGAFFGEIYEAGFRVFSDRGYDHLLGDTTLGHGLGLDMHEPPTITQDSRTEIKENMVVTVEPWTLNYSDWTMGANQEDTVRVTQQGVEMLTPEWRTLVIR
jgi:Xaa-Pro aminopeptidase